MSRPWKTGSSGEETTAEAISKIEAISPRLRNVRWHSLEDRRFIVTTRMKPVQVAPYVAKKGIKHGTFSGHNYHGCRCRACREFIAARRRKTTPVSRETTLGSGQEAV